MKNRTLKTLALAVTSIAALGGCELLAGLGDTDLAQDQPQPDSGTIDVDVGDVVTTTDAGEDATVIVVSDHDQTCAQGGASSPMTVSCNPGQVITGASVALYGRFDGSCTEGFTIPDGGACPPTDPDVDAGSGKRHLTTAQAIEMLCGGLRSCTFVPESLRPMVADPCSGTEKAFAVQVTCAAATAPTVPDGGIGDPYAIDLDAREIPGFTFGAQVTTWADPVNSKSAAPYTAGSAPTLATNDTGADAGGGASVRITAGHALVLPASSGGNTYLSDFSTGLTMFVVANPRAFSVSAPFLFLQGSTTPNEYFTFGGSDDPKARGLTVRTANAGPSLTAYGAWNLDYPQLYSYVVRPLPADVVPIDTTLASGYAWGIGSIYVGELAVAESFQAIPPSVDRSAVLVGRQQPPNVDSLTADISEIRVYKGALDATKLETEQRWLESEWHLCDGVDFQSDPANCGGCGVLCTAGAKCDFGVCNDVDLASWELVNRSSGTSSVLIGPPDTSPDGGAAHAVSWAQAENTCALEGFPLATPTTTDDNNLLSGNFASASVTRNRSVGALRENGSARSAVDLSALAFAPYAGTTPYGCTDMRADGSWITTPGCNASGARDWACLLPAVPLPTIAGCMTFGDAAPGKHAYAICPQVYPNEPTRKAACAALKVGANNGSELVIESASQAAAVGLLRTGPYPVAFDLTSARKNPRWTLGNGSPAPLIAWDGTFNHQTSVPPFVVGPACATLNMDGTMSDESCFAPSTVACALPDGTPAPTAIRSFSPSFNFASPSGGSLGVSLIDTAGTATQPVPFVLTHVKPGDHIVATFNFSGSWQFIGQTVTMTVGSYPGSTTCVSAYYVGSNTWAQTSDWSYPFTAGLPGVYLIAVDPNNITGCTAPNWSLNGAFPLTIGAIQVDAQ